MINTPEVEALTADGCRIDDLQVNGMVVLQHPDRYCFTTDPIILAHFAKATPKTRCVDLGSGSGVIGMLLVGKYGAAACKCVELQEYFVRMSRASAEANGLETRVEVVHCRIQDAYRVIGDHRYDLVVSNPPYTAAGDGERNENREIAIARHEVELNLEELVAAADKLVKYGGRFCMIHQAERLAEICCVLGRYGFAPKRIRPVEGRVGLAPTLVLIDSKKGGKVGVRLERSLTLYDRDGRETEELSRIYGRGGGTR